MGGPEGTNSYRSASSSPFIWSRHTRTVGQGDLAQRVSGPFEWQQGGPSLVQEGPLCTLRAGLVGGESPDQMLFRWYHAVVGYGDVVQLLCTVPSLLLRGGRSVVRVGPPYVVKRSCAAARPVWYIGIVLGEHDRRCSPPQFPPHLAVPPQRRRDRLCAVGRLAGGG